MSGQTFLCYTCGLTIEFDFTSMKWRDHTGRSNRDEPFTHQHMDYTDAQERHARWTLTKRSDVSEN